MPTMVFIYHRWKMAVILEKSGRDAFSKIKNQLTEFEKDKIEFLWKHFQEGKALSNLTQTESKKVF